MEVDLIELLKFADEAIGRYITFYLTGAAAIAALVMSDGYRRNFKKLGKIILTICLAVVAYHNWSTLVYYHTIYNATVDSLSMYKDAHAILFGAEGGVLTHKPIRFVHLGHIMGGLVMLSLIWWIEVQGTFRTKLLNKWRLLKSRRR